MSYINSISTAVPGNKHPQEHIAGYMGKVYQKSFAVNHIYRETAIDYRHSVLKDFGLELEEGDFFHDRDPSVEERMQRYFEEAPELAERAIEQLDHQDVTHLITVSCTGLAAPGLEIELQERMGFRSDIQKATVNFMGCYAALHALRLADWICKSEEKAKVLIVCVELCTLHFQKEYKFEYLASGSLFADGAAAVLVSNQATGLHMKGFFTDTNSEARDAMDWTISSKGFLMNLSSKVADSIGHVIVDSLRNATEQKQLPFTESDHWAVHPGGRKILEVVRDAFALKDDQIEDSFEVLSNYGNMSSPTILFILKSLLEKEVSGSITGLAFGPGLTIEGIYLEK